MQAMDEPRIRSRIKSLIEKSQGRIDEASYGEIVHGAASVITLVYGPGSRHLAALERAIADEQKRVFNETRSGDTGRHACRTGCGTDREY